MEGILLEAESGDYLGKHRGFWFYTIGQRQGLRLPGGPWWVTKEAHLLASFAEQLSLIPPTCVAGMLSRRIHKIM